jgi:hypothetical protein
MEKGPIILAFARNHSIHQTNPYGKKAGMSNMEQNEFHEVVKDDARLLLAGPRG